MANLFRCGGANKYTAGTLNNFTQSALTYYSVNCGATPKGCIISVNFSGYVSIIYCDLATDTFIYNGTVYSAKNYVEVIGNTIKVNIGSLSGNIWNGFGYGYR